MPHMEKSYHFHYRRIAYTDIESVRLLLTDATSEAEASLTVIINGCKVAINNHAGGDVIYHTISCGNFDR